MDKDEMEGTSVCERNKSAASMCRELGGVHLGATSPLISPSLGWH
jgi:hypothetical protein